MKKIKVSILAITFLMIFITAFSVSALPANYDCVNAFVTDINPTSVKIGEEFTIGIAVENCGDTIPENVDFELEDAGPFIGIKESLVKDIGTLRYSNSKRFIVYHMKVANDAVPGTYEFNYKLRFGSETSYSEKQYSFGISVVGDDAELGIASVKIDPVLPSAGDTVEITLRVENIGSGKAKSVNVYADHSFMGTKQSFIGTLDSNEDGPAIITLIANESGEIEIPVFIRYSDDFGDGEIETAINMVVLKPEETSGQSVAIISVSVIIIILIFVIYRTKKSKDKIIKELMNGNDETSINKNNKKKK